VQLATVAANISLLQTPVNPVIRYVNLITRGFLFSLTHRDSNSFHPIQPLFWTIFVTR